MSSAVRAAAVRLTAAVLLSVAPVPAAQSAQPAQPAQSPQPSQAKLPQISLQSLDRVDDLRASFNRDGRHVRLVLLLSPT
ncbi:hypothetical protein BH18ACI5_BH18ACI5_26410 [soil metagenome]